MNVMASISAPPPAGQFSRADFERMVATGAFADMWVELIGGELHRMPPPGAVHGRLQAALIVALAAVVASELLTGETGIDLGNDTIVGADTAIFAAAGGDKGWVPAANVRLAVEIALSTRDRDLNLNRRLYAAAGIPTYWVIDADRAVIHVFDRPERDDYLGLALVRFGEPLAVPGTDATIVLS